MAKDWMVTIIQLDQSADTMIDECDLSIHYKIKRVIE